MPGATEVVHATALAVDGRAALIRGPSGAGKSDLALRCLSVGPSPLIPVPALLVADDRVRLERVGNKIGASAPDAIRGKLEVRGVGIISVPTAPAADVVLVLDLVPAQKVERLPEGASVNLLGVDIALLKLAAFEHSAHLKLLVALAGHTGRARSPR